MKNLFPVAYLLPALLFGIIGFRECASEGWGNASAIAWAAGFAAFLMIFLIQFMIGEIANFRGKLAISSCLSLAGSLFLIFGYLS